MIDDKVVEALIDIRETLFRMVNNHDICFENNSDECVYPRLEEAAEMIDMGGQEKDYRDEGGFVAMGGEERADDVPARLSKNEFVFTADAVRAAGGGDVDRGANLMYKTMKNLESRVG